MIKCPICHSTITESLLRWDTYSINRCDGCHLIFSTPTPSEEELSAYYQGFMFRKTEERVVERATKKKIRELKKTSGLNSGEGVRFLDFGGGTGITYHAADQLGFDAYYQDLDLQSAQFVMDNFGLPQDKFITDISATPDRFDIIFSDNVIEHSPDPITFIRMLYDKLDQDGLLVLKTPHAGNAESWFNPVVLLKEYFLPALQSNSFSAVFKAVLKGFWHCAPPRHLFSFSKKSLKILALELGIRESECSISYYSAPLFSNTLTEYVYASRCGGKSGGVLILFCIIALPVALLEILIHLTGIFLVKCGLVSAAGIVLKVKRSGKTGSQVEPA